MAHEVKIHCDVVHPASGEVLAETGETLDGESPKLARVFSVVLEYPDFYTCRLEDDMAHIRCIPPKKVGWSNGRGYGYFPKGGGL